MKSSKLGFITVGMIAGAVHYSVAIIAHAYFLGPAGANWVGFFCAFPISYLGHRYWSFSGTAVSTQDGVSRFFFVALLGFLVNQLLLHWTLLNSSMPFWLALAVVDGVVATGTWLLSKRWAFGHA